MLWNDGHSERDTGNANSDSHTGTDSHTSAQRYSDANTWRESLDRLQP
jgi:hypothetical protein